MSAGKREPTRLADYAPPPFLIDDADLSFDLDLERTRVRARLSVRRNPDASRAADLVLDGEGLEPVSARVIGDPEATARIRIGEDTLTVANAPDRFALETEAVVCPRANESLEGLYRSGTALCTQCEAEGFRRITWFLDRPDVLSRYRVRLSGSRELYPRLLSNGNCVGEGVGANGTHWAEWEDPFPKPSYLFALVAGPLDCLEDSFVTRSGRQVALQIYAKPGDAERCRHAMESLKKAMRWDEEAYGFEYDLDRFMIAVIDDFNMGAMENKGLNVFNSVLVLARPDTATDADYAAIESVVAHEYFHNWTGNRITCRDWFQLSLKEGLTVFRDQQFSEDVASRAVERIRQARTLRTVQFPEDAGPMAHPVRPETYVEINNFYTSTVYCKGAEVIRMLHTLLGNDAYQAGMRTYVRRHDGQAVTIEDFVAAMEDASGRDLAQFRRWYSQAGTPEIEVQGSHDAAAGEYALALAQRMPPTPGQPEKRPLLVPLRVALLGESGEPVPLYCDELGLDGETEAVIEFDRERASFRFRQVSAAPVPSVARHFSAPVRIRADRSDAELAMLTAKDTDPFNRWDACQEYATRLLMDRIADYAPGSEASVPDSFADAMRALLLDPGLDPAFVAEALRLPPESNLADRMETVAVEAIHDVREGFARSLSRALRDSLASVRASLRTDAAYVFEPRSAGRRSLANVCLGYLMRLEEPETAAECTDQLRNSDNMTDSIAALQAFAGYPGPERRQAFDWFFDRWRGEPLALDKWLAVQATSPRPEALEDVRSLMAGPAFDIRNPNRVRALLGAFFHRNQRRFHDASGAGYRFLADQVLAVDAFNPSVAARLLSAASRWRRLDRSRRELLRAEVERVSAAPKLSRDCYEIATRTLAAN